MKTKTWLSLFCCSLFFALPVTLALAQGHGKANGHYNKDKGKDHDDDDDRRGYGYGARDRDEFRKWYAVNYKHLPPGLAKKNRLPPGLEKKLVIHGRIEPEFQQYTYVVPVELERRLPPPPPDCERVVIGGHIVLRNRSTNIVVDIFHFE